MPESDESLFLQFQAGSQQSLQVLASRYDAALMRFFARRLRDGGLAPDLVQETLIALLRNRGQVELQCTFRAYLFGVAFRVMLAANRRDRLARERSVDLGVEIADHYSTHSLEQGLWVRQVMEKLDSAEREILMLREYEQLTYEDIAELLRVPLNTVRSRLYRARLAFREQAVCLKGDAVCRS